MRQLKTTTAPHVKGMLSPVVLFVYNRPWHTQQTIDSLKKNILASESVLYIFSDAPKNNKANQGVSEVREIISQVSGFKKVIVVEQTQNLGLASSVIGGVSNVLESHDRVIVLEDDLLTSPYFLSYMNKALDFYGNSENIFSVTGFSFSSDFMNFPADFDDDVYLNIRPMSWSWATWKSEWQNLDWEIQDFHAFLSSNESVKKFNQGGTDLTPMLKAQMGGHIDSWYIRWTYNAYLKGKHTIYPKKSFVNNIGHDNTGVHCGVDKHHILSHTELNFSSQISFYKNPMLNSEIVSNFNKAFNFPLKTKLKLSIKAMLNYVKGA